MMELCDVHGHFLPGMDDGCKTPEEALQVLKSSYAQGVRRMFATPHYYPVETVSDFLERRQASCSRLAELAWEHPDIPRICLGAEVAYRPGIGYLEDLHKLCIGSSRYLLLELPFARWNRELVRDVRNMCAVAGVTPILAHIERYLDNGQSDILEQLLELDVLVQMNAGYLLRFSTARKGRQLLKNGMVHLLGSDCHNMTTRPPKMGEAAASLQKKGMTDVLSEVMALSEDIFREASAQK